MRPDQTDRPVKRIPRVTIRHRSGRRCLRHGLRLGWRIEYPETFPVTVTYVAVTRSSLRRAA